MDPKQKDLVTRFSLMAKKIIYEPQRMKALLKMLNTQAGALHAVQTVIGGIEQNRPVPPEIIGMLAVNVYLILVECATMATKTKPNPKMMKETMRMIAETYKKGYGMDQQPGGKQPGMPQEPAPPPQMAQPPQQAAPQPGLMGA